MDSQAIVKLFKRFPTASICFIVTALLAVIVYYRWTGYPELQSQLADVEAEWRTIEANVIKNSVNLEEHLASINRISDDAERRFINRTELGRNYRYFYGLENATGIELSNLQQLQPARGPRSARGDAEGENDAPFSRVGYNMSVTGTFPEVLAFMYSLEDGEHFYRLNTVTFQRVPGERERLVSAALNFELLGRP